MDRHWVLYDLDKRRPLAARTKPTLEGYLAWIGVYPLDPKRPSTEGVLNARGLSVASSAGPFFTVRRFEVDQRHLARGTSLSEPDLANSRSYIVCGNVELERQLQELGVALTDLERVFKTDYPI